MTILVRCVMVTKHAVPHDPGCPHENPNLPLLPPQRVRRRVSRPLYLTLLGETVKLVPALSPHHHYQHHPHRRRQRLDHEDLPARCNPPEQARYQHTR